MTTDPRATAAAGGAGNDPHRPSSSAPGLFQSSHDGIAFFGLDGRVQQANQSFLRLLRYDLPGIQALAPESLTPDSCRDADRRMVEEQVLVRGFSDEYEKEFLRSDGARVPVAIQLGIVRDGKGKPLRMMGLVRDLSLQKRAERTLQETEIFLRQVINLVPQFIFVRDREGRFVLANEAAARQFGVRVPDLIGRRYADLHYHPRGADLVREEDRRIIDLGETVHLPDARVPGADGAERIFEVTKLPCTLPGKDERVVLGIAVDITERVMSERELRAHRDHLDQLVAERTWELTEANERLQREVTIRKRVEHALRESERRYRHITESITDYIYSVVVVDGTPAHTTHGRACVSVTGFTSEEFSADPFLWYRMVPAEDRPLIQAQAEAILTHHEAHPVEHRIVRKDGAVRWVRNTPVLHFDAAGGLTGYDGLVSDITERRLAEEAQRESEQRYKRISESVTDYIFTVTIENGTAVRTDHGAGCVAVTGYTAEEFERDPELWIRMVREEHRAAVAEHARRSLAGEGSESLEHQIIRKDGALRWVRNTPVPHRGPDGVLLSYDGLISDITERKEAELEKDRVIAELQEALNNIKTLRGLLPICASCKKVRDDNGYWEQVETYIQQHSQAQFTHGICPDCMHSLYPELKAANRG